jgi:hypothetical protein
MTEDDLKAEIDKLRAETADLKAQVAAFAEAGKPPTPFKSDYVRPPNPVDRVPISAIPKSVRDDIAKTFDPDLIAGLRADAHPNAYKAGAPKSVGQPEVERGSGYRDGLPLGPPPGLPIMDAMMDRQDEIDKADLARRLARSVKKE